MVFSSNNNKQKTNIDLFCFNIIISICSENLLIQKTAHHSSPYGLYRKRMERHALFASATLEEFRENRFSGQSGAFSIAIRFP